MIDFNKPNSKNIEVSLSIRDCERSPSLSPEFKPTWYRLDSNDYDDLLLKKLLRNTIVIYCKSKFPDNSDKFENEVKLETERLKKYFS